METQKRLWYKSCFRPHAVTYPLLVYMCITQVFIQPLKGEINQLPKQLLYCVLLLLFLRLGTLVRHTSRYLLGTSTRFAKWKNTRTIIITEFVKKSSSDLFTKCLIIIQFYNILQHCKIFSQNFPVIFREKTKENNKMRQRGLSEIHLCSG